MLDLRTGHGGHSIVTAIAAAGGICLLNTRTGQSNPMVPHLLHPKVPPPLIPKVRAGLSPSSTPRPGITPGGSISRPPMQHHSITKHHGLLFIEHAIPTLVQDMHVLYLADVGQLTTATTNRFIPQVHRYHQYPKMHRFHPIVMVGVRCGEETVKTDNVQGQTE